MAVIVSAISSSLYATGLLELGDLNWYDGAYRFLHRRQTTSEDRLVVVGIDERDIEEYGYPLTDEKLLRLLKKVKEQQPSAIGLDLYRNLPYPPGTEQLNSFLSSSDRVYGIEKAISGGGEDGVGANPVLKAASRSGSNDAILDSDGKIRRYLLFTYPKNNPMLPSFAVSLAGAFLFDRKVAVDERSDGFVSWGGHPLAPLQSYSGGYAGIDGGYQLQLRFRGAPGSFQTISMKQLLAGDFGKDDLKNKIVLIGYTAPSINDLYLTPYQQRMSGVEIQANAIAQILSASIDGERQPFLVPYWLNFAVLFSTNCYLSWWWCRSRSLKKDVAGFIVVLALIIGVWAAFFSNFIWFAIFPYLISLSSIFPVALHFKGIERVEVLSASLKELLLEKEKELTDVQQIAMLGKISAAIGHEIKNPLSHIVSLCEYLTEVCLDDDAKSAAELTLQQALRINKIVDDVLSFSYGSSVDKVAVDLNFAVHSSWDIALNSVGDRPNVSLSVNIPDRQKVDADPHLLQRALVNLFKNAIEASISHRQKAQCQISVWTQKASEGRIILSIQDEGIGISPDNLPRIFEPFFTTKKSGSGLGLWIAYESIRRLGGEISASSVTGSDSYTKFDLHL